MKARARFFAMGQSHEARGMAYTPQWLGMGAWPHWAKQAYCGGRLSVHDAVIGAHLDMGSIRITRFELGKGPYVAPVRLGVT